MGNEGSYVALGLKVWKAQIDRADKLFGSLSSEEVLREIAPGRNRLLYLWGHLTAIHDAMLPLLGLRERLHPEFDVAFVSNPDKSRAGIPSHEQVRRAWNVVNAELWKGFEKMSWSDWVQRHSAVSEAPGLRFRKPLMRWCGALSRAANYAKTSSLSISCAPSSAFPTSPPAPTRSKAQSASSISSSLARVRSDRFTEPPGNSTKI